MKRSKRKRVNRIGNSTTKSIPTQKNQKKFSTEENEINGSYIVKGVGHPNFTDVLEILFLSIFFISALYAEYYIFAIFCVLYMIYCISQIKKECENRKSFMKIDKYSFHVFDACASDEYDVKWKEVEKIVIYNERSFRTSVKVLALHLKKEKYPIEFVLDNCYKVNFDEFYESLLFYNPSLILIHP